MVYITIVHKQGTDGLVITIGGLVSIIGAQADPVSVRTQQKWAASVAMGDQVSQPRQSMCITVAFTFITLLYLACAGKGSEVSHSAAKDGKVHQKVCF